MAKTTTRTKSAKTHGGVGVRGRDAEFPSASIRVSEDAQTKTIDVNAAREFNFARPDRNQLPERPSTSGGPANYSMRTNAEKRETKDDLHFNPLAAHGRGTTFYDFPLPGSLPTPSHTPKASPPLPENSSLPRSDTPDSLDIKPVAMNVQQAEIGMALGSPTHQPALWQQRTTTFNSHAWSPPPDDDIVMDGWTGQPLPSKHKASKWKILGGLFGGGKKQSNPQTFYQLQHETTHQATVETDDVLSGGPPGTSERKPSKPRGRGRTNSVRKTEKHKPGLKRAHTTPTNFESYEHVGRLQPPMPKITIDEGSTVNGAIQVPSNHGGLMLDVAIPSVQMERYSVMFGSVLQKPGSSTTSSSLLARRQATLDRLKTVNEALALKEREIEEKAKLLKSRRATSPQLTKSPAFSLFPPTPSRLSVQDMLPSPSAHHASHLQRSNTSPAALSPSRPSFAPRADNEMHATLVGPASRTHENQQPQEQYSTQRKRDIREHKGPKVDPLSRQPLASSTISHEENRNRLPEGSRLALNSPISECAEEDVYDPAPIPMKPKLEEPHWKMIVPYSHQTTLSVSGSSSSSSEGNSTSTSTSSVSMASIGQSTTRKHVAMQAPPATRRSRSATTSSAVRPQPEEVSRSNFGSPVQSTSTPIPEGMTITKVETREGDQEREERLKSAADISIARQISVSRQQRQLLIPIKKSSSLSSPKNDNKSLNPSFPSPLNITRVASPLGAVAAAAAAAESPIAGRGGSPRARLERKNTAERLMQSSANPSTPTLVIVGGGTGDVERAWGGNMATSSPVLEGRGGTGSGELRVGLAAGGLVELGNRKSERIVLESV